jgi:hypothetical protein
LPHDGQNAAKSDISAPQISQNRAILARSFSELFWKSITENVGAKGGQGTFQGLSILGERTVKRARSRAETAQLEDVAEFHIGERL